MARVEIITGASGAGRGVRSRSGRLSMRPLRRGRSSPTSPGVRRFAPGRSIAGGRSWQASSGFSQVVIAAMADGGNDRGALNPAPASRSSLAVPFACASRR
jgi:hypothetical protein